MLYSISDLLKSKPVCSVTLRGNKKAPHLRGKVNTYNWAAGTVIKVEVVNIPQGAGEIELCGPAGLHWALNVYNGYCYTVFFTGRLRDSRFKLSCKGSDITE